MGDNYNKVVVTRSRQIFQLIIDIHFYGYR